MKKVSIFCIGAARAGTTWIASNLARNPNIFVPNEKELNYFNKNTNLIPDKINPDYSKSINWFHQRYFASSTHNQLWADCSVSYMLFSNCAQDIHRYNPESKIVISLRNPIDQTVSLYFYFIQIGIIEDIPFEVAIEKYKNILFLGKYYEQLVPYLKVFRRDQILILYYKDIKSGPEQELIKLFTFLEVDFDMNNLLLDRVNKTGKSRYPYVNHFIQSARKFIHKNNLTFLLPIVHSLRIEKLSDYIVKINYIESNEINFDFIKTKHYQMLWSYYEEDFTKLASLLGEEFNKLK